MNKMNLSAVLAIALSLSAASRAMAGSPPPAQAAAVATHKAAKGQIKQDETTLKGDWDAQAIACKTKGPGCDAAKAKVAADRAKVLTDKTNVAQAAAKLKSSGVLGQTKASAKKRTAKAKKPKKARTQKPKPTPAATPTQQ